MNIFKVQFLSPDNQISLNKVTSLSIEGPEGQLTILAHHSPYLIYLLPSIITVKMGSQRQERVVIGNGVLKVAKNDCRIMSNQVQIFDRIVHDQKSLKNKCLNMQLNYFFSE